MEKQAKLSIWNQLGPVLLLGSFAALFLKCAPVFWPLALTAFIGYATILYFKKGGLFLSFFILAAVALLLVRSRSEFVWPLLLTASIALSWWLIFLSDKEASSLHFEQEQKLQSLEENSRLLDKQLREAKVSISKESKDLIVEKERLNTQLNQTRNSLQVSEKKTEKLSEKCEQLSQDLFSLQRKEIAFQHALEEAQSQVLKLKAALEKPKELAPTIVPMQEDSAQEQWQYQYGNLREQFVEKSEALDQARKELFKLENDYLALQRTMEEQVLEGVEEDLLLIKNLKRLEEEQLELEMQVSHLQELVTSLISPKKRNTKVKKSLNSSEDGLPLLIQEKIDQTWSKESI